MYGLLLEGVQHFVESTYGTDMWLAVLEISQVDDISFQTRLVYNESTIRRIMTTLAECVGLTLDDIMFSNGCFFVSYLSRYGYDKILRVLGRDFVEFIRGLDNLHEYLRFSYPKIKPPSFIVGDRLSNGLILHYRTRRSGFQHYVRGQLVTIAKKMYNIDLDVRILQERTSGHITHYAFQLVFDIELDTPTNESCVMDFKGNFEVRSRDFFEIFPFHLVIGNELQMISVGAGLNYLYPKIIDGNFEEMFIVARPFIDPNFELMKMHIHNVFELILIKAADYSNNEARLALKNQKAKAKRMSSVDSGSIKFKGQMIYMEAWNALMFIGTPIIRDVNQLEDLGLYLNDLNMHDTSRDVIFAGSQQSDEIMELFENQMKNSKHMEESMRKLHQERKRTDELLYSCIPKGIAKHLRRGDSSESTIKCYELVSICFSKVVDFTDICGKIEVHQIVALLNAMYTIFDNYTESHKVYKVETIGDSYMLVSGAPNRTVLHASHIAEMALDMLTGVEKLENPANPGSSVQIYLGCHSGPIVSGVVGVKMPRYCLFGDAVNTSSRMMSHGEPNRIHVTDTFKEQLHNCPYNLRERGKMEIKGKGLMTTYFLESRQHSTIYEPFFEELEADRLREDESPQDSVASSRMATPNLADQNYTDHPSDDEDTNASYNPPDMVTFKVESINFEQSQTEIANAIALNVGAHQTAENGPENNLLVIPTPLPAKENLPRVKKRRDITFNLENVEPDLSPKESENENTHEINAVNEFNKSRKSRRPSTPPALIDAQEICKLLEKLPDSRFEEPINYPPSSDTIPLQLVEVCSNPDTPPNTPPGERSIKSSENTPVSTKSEISSSLQTLYSLDSSNSSCDRPKSSSMPKRKIGIGCCERDGDLSIPAEREIVRKATYGFYDSEQISLECHGTEGYKQTLDHLGKVLSEGLAELAVMRPQDPIEYLGLWLRNYIQSAKSSTKSR